MFLFFFKRNHLLIKTMANENDTNDIANVSVSVTPVIISALQSVSIIPIIIISALQNKILFFF